MKSTTLSIIFVFLMLLCLDGKSQELKPSKDASGNYGLSDKNGKIIIPYEYQYLRIEYAYIAAKQNDKYGLLSFDNKIIIPFIYQSITILKDGLGCVSMESNGKKALITTNGILKTGFDYDQIYEFHDGTAVVSIDKKYGYIDTIGKYIIPCKYTYGRSFYKGLAAVSDGGQYYLINKKGESVSKSYEGLYRYNSNNFYMAENNNNYGLVNSKGIEILECNYYFINVYGYNLAYVTKCYQKQNDEEECKTAIFDIDNAQFTTSFEFDYIEQFYEGSMYNRVFKGYIDWDSLNGKYGLIDTNGNQFVGCVYDWIFDYQDDIARVFVGKMETEGIPLKGKFSLINKKGKELIPFKYDWLYEFNDDLARVKLGNKWGYISLNGQETIPLKYDQAEDFENSKAKVDIGGHTFYINTKGECIENCTR